MNNLSNNLLRTIKFSILIPAKQTLSWYIWYIERKLAGTDKKLVDDYFSKHQIIKLHIGCGSNILNGWLNTDLYSKDSQVNCLDATKPFSFNNDSFDYIYSEHMIEHITYIQGLQFLSECYRVLKPGGKIRIATPDLVFLIDLYKNDKSILQKDYIKWSIDKFIGAVTNYEDTFVINNFMRAWGHTFIYDEKVLHNSLGMMGFNGITKCALNESADEQLRYLENETRMPPGFLELESIIIEATKPIKSNT